MGCRWAEVTQHEAAPVATDVAADQCGGSMGRAQTADIVQISARNQSTQTEQLQCTDQPMQTEQHADRTTGGPGADRWVHQQAKRGRSLARRVTGAVIKQQRSDGRHCAIRAQINQCRQSNIQTCQRLDQDGTAGTSAGTARQNNGRASDQCH